MPIIDEEDARACCAKPKSTGWTKFFIFMTCFVAALGIASNMRGKPSVKLISYYPESVTVEQGKQKITVDGLQMTQFVLSGVRIIVNGDTLRNVNCEMAKH